MFLGPLSTILQSPHFSRLHVEKSPNSVVKVCCSSTSISSSQPRYPKSILSLFEAKTNTKAVLTRQHSIRVLDVDDQDTWKSIFAPSDESVCPEMMTCFTTITNRHTTLTTSPNHITCPPELSRTSQNKPILRKNFVSMH